MTDALDHPWLGGLFGDAEAAAIWSPERQLGHMLAFEVALLRAQATEGDAPEDRADPLADLIEAADIAPADLRDGTARDGVPVPALVARLRAMAGADAPLVHAGATSQDVMDTGLALSLRETGAALDARLAALTDALDALAARDGAREIMGRTRMQAALPIRAAQRIAAWRRPIPRHRDRIAAATEDAARLQLGGPVGDRATLGPSADAVSARMAEALGLADGPAWHAERDGPVAVAAAYANLCVSLGKIGTDVGLMVQQGVDDARLAGGGGSSAMAHKANPVRAEILAALARHAATLAGGMLHAGLHEQERSGAAWALEWLTLPPLARVAMRATALATEVVGDLTIGAAGTASPQRA
ncbi:3-carboxy-cis,cis-muconate cycloisomerase [Palleronia rufa]|uniref:3-carboxy-cis,cis-muconate cycloisomerase n=1 Tax=Palleronia rufa TaxID=1530186 RepID=UPI00055E65D5|nr:3-carboxy-cis,cis-muconate cycloisomerase [Palleronia rufa]